MITPVRNGNTFTLTITQDVTDLVNDKNLTNTYRVKKALERCMAQLQLQIQACDGSSVASIDAQIADLQTRRNAMPQAIVNF